MKQSTKIKIIEFIKKLLRFEDSNEYIKIETHDLKPINIYNEILINNKVFDNQFSSTVIDQKTHYDQFAGVSVIEKELKDGLYKELDKLVQIKKVDDYINNGTRFIAKITVLHSEN